MDLRGRLFVVGTPIGNLEDMTFRSVRILKEVDIVVAEDTRRARILKEKFDVATPVASYHEHSRSRVTDDLIARMKAGVRVALISDAGMPLVSDPGLYLVQKTLASGIAVEVIPGPSAVLAALVASGFEPAPFHFEGYLPKTDKALRSRVEVLSDTVEETIVAFVSPHVFQKTLKVLETVCPKREIAVCRELTKLHEEVVRGQAGVVGKHFSCGEVKGEITLVISRGPKKERNAELEIVRERIRALKGEHIGVKECVERIVKEGYDVSKRVIYRMWHEEK